MESKADLTIPFPFPVDDSDDINPIVRERHEFWDSPRTVQWFDNHGYTLYKRTTRPDSFGRPLCTTVPVLPSEDFVEAQYPYPYHDNYADGEWGIPRRATEPSGKVVFAQDAQNRHVAIKLVPDGTDELRILRFLSSQDLETLKANCLIPVLDFLPINGFCFVVMPRWGSRIYLPQQSTIRDGLQIMHSMLKGLSFLHEHNILHRDIKLGNVLVNQFSDSEGMTINPGRVKLRSSGCLLYAMFDFDISIMVSPDINKMEYRLPYPMSWCGSYIQPYDTAQGEFDYDPFAYDVGTMGREFCKYYQHLSKEVPMLAPFLDRMTTRNIPLRFTATEALRFFETFLAEIPEDVLQEMNPKPGGISIGYDVYDRWQHVSPEFAKKWAAYREPPIPMFTKVLRWLCSDDYMAHIIPSIRWFFFKIWAHPRRFSTFFVGLRW